MQETTMQTARRHRRAMLDTLGDGDAVRFCEAFFHITQIWDDLVDGDREVGPEDVDRAFWSALIEMPSNPFYIRHAPQLNAFIAQSACAWFDANTLEKGSIHDKTLAFVLRDAVGGLIGFCAYLLGGYDWMRAVSPDLRRLAHEEKLGTYLRGLK